MLTKNWNVSIVQCWRWDLHRVLYDSYKIVHKLTQKQKSPARISSYWCEVEAVGSQRSLLFHHDWHNVPFFLTTGWTLTVWGFIFPVIKASRSASDMTMVQSAFLSADRHTKGSKSGLSLNFLSSPAGSRPPHLCRCERSLCRSSHPQTRWPPVRSGRPSLWKQKLPRFSSQTAPHPAKRGKGLHEERVCLAMSEAVVFFPMFTSCSFLLISWKTAWALKPSSPSPALVFHAWILKRLQI